MQSHQAKMVAVQVLLMNYFLLGLHTDHHISNDVLLPDVAVGAGGECSYGCTQCSAINGCLSCKHPYFLYVHREGSRQTAVCTRSCPVGFYKLKRKNKRGFCAKCTLRGCRECSTRHYCSVCKKGLVRHAGRCRRKCPEGTLLSVRFPGLCLSAPESIPDAAPNEIDVNGTIPSRKPPSRHPGTREPGRETSRRPHLHPEHQPSSPPTHPHHPQGVPNGTPQHPRNPEFPLQFPDDPSVTQVEEPIRDYGRNPLLLYPELTTFNSTTSSSGTTLRPRRRKKKKRKKKRKKEKDKRRHEKSRRRKSRERRRRKRLRNKERRKKKEEEDSRRELQTTVSPMIPPTSS